MTQIWRLPLRSGREERRVDHAAQIRYCVSKGIAAVGWGVTRGDLKSVLREIESTYGVDGRNGKNTVARFANAPDGDLVWTLDKDGTYCVGELCGPWRYDDSPEADRFDCYQVRPTHWAPIQLLSSEVPGAVIRSFSQLGSAFQMIHDENAARYSRRLFEQLTGRPLSEAAPTPAEVLKSHLGPMDVEDLVYTYLQIVRGYAVLPASRRRDTSAYEYVLVHRGDHHQAVVQVKTGAATVDFAQLLSAAAGGHRAYAYQSGEVGEVPDGLELITQAELLRFMETQPEFLPPRVRKWLAR